MPELGNKPNGIPSSSGKPEINPPEEVPTKTWPDKNPEIIPEQEPESSKPPHEIPSPSDD